MFEKKQKTEGQHFCCKANQSAEKICQLTENVLAKNFVNCMLMQSFTKFTGSSLLNYYWVLGQKVI